MTTRKKVRTLLEFQKVALRAWGKCLRCKGSFEPGWVCAEHPHKPWKHDDCGSEGSPCPVCNPRGEVQWERVYATTDP
jgi:hypothetical protein